MPFSKSQDTSLWLEPHLKLILDLFHYKEKPIFFNKKKNYLRKVLTICVVNSSSFSDVNSVKQLIESFAV